MSEEEKNIPAEEASAAETPAADEGAKENTAKKKDKKAKGKGVTFTAEEAERLEHLAEELENSKGAHLRLMAEYDNYRKRTAKEKEAAYVNAKADTIEPFLAIYDNFERALKTEGDDNSPHRKGIEMMFEQFKGILEKLGVAIMDCEGKEFDPERHNAVMHIEDESFGENVIAEVFQQGFIMGDKVLRFAVVKVAN